jgi:hypothetical protein
LCTPDLQDTFHLVVLLRSNMFRAQLLKTLLSTHEESATIIS